MRASFVVCKPRSGVKAKAPVEGSMSMYARTR